MTQGKKHALAERDYVTVASMAAAGHRHVDVARRLGIDPTTWREVRGRDERAVEAWEGGRSELHAELMSKLLEQAKKGDRACLIFALKSVYGYSDRPAPQQHLHDHRVRIELPGALDRDRYAREVKQIADAKGVVVDAEYTVEPKPRRKALKLKRRKRARKA
jgi:hypothetical protein